jgi:hypothetical protein
VVHNVKTIKFNSKYVSGKALELITNFDTNTYIIKGSTGIGGTTALLNYIQSNCLIISPNVGMIKGKEGKQYTSDKQLFIYASSKDKWSDAIDYLENEDNTNLVINTTPDQICLIRETKNELYNKIRTFNVFVDEFHVYTTDATFRNSVGQLMELIFNDWLAKFKLSTATPNYNLIDIPRHVELGIYKLERENQPKKRLSYSYDINDVKPFINDEVDKGRLVVLFTNNGNYHKSFRHLRVHNLVGETLKIKLAPFLRGQNGIDYPNDTQLLIVSSSFFAGFDIEQDCSMIFVSEELMQQRKINLNNLMQAYGRGRNTVHNALYVNARALKNNENVVTTLKDVNNAVQQAENDIIKANNELKSSDNFSFKPQYVKSSELRAKAIQVANDYLQYNLSIMINELISNNFEVCEYDNRYTKDIITQSTATLFQDRIKNLLALDEKHLRYSYSTIKKNLTYKDNPTFSTGLALEYITSLLIKKSDCHLVSMLDNKRLRPNEFYNSMNLFLRVNHPTKYLSEQLTPEQQRKAESLHKQDEYKDKLSGNWWLIKDWYYLFAVHKLKKGIFTKDIERNIVVYEKFYDVDIYNTNAKDKTNRVRNTRNYILKQISDKNVILTEKELERLEDTIKGKFIRKDLGDTLTNGNTKAHIVAKMVNAILFLWSSGKNEVIKEVKGREYHSITQIAGAFRPVVPIKWLSVDLTSANPQIIDNILGSNIALEVYKNLMISKGISRDRAKTLYNSYLNNHYHTVEKAYNFYLGCGYTAEQAKQLSKLTAQVPKGSFHEIATLSERKLMLDYANTLPLKTHRFHDAIIMEYEDVLKNNITLPNLVNDYVYHTDFFNDSSHYDNVTNEKVYTSNGFIHNHKVA